VRPLACALTAAFALAAHPAPAAVVLDLGPPTDVLIATPDGMRIAGRWWSEPTPGSAAAVLVLSRGDDADSWLPLVRALRAREVEVLAVDVRGAGGSAVQHGVRLEDDPTLAREMHADVTAAASWLVREGGCGAQRIALVGAELGGLVALDAAVRARISVAAAVVLRPPAALGGLDAAGLARELTPATQLLIVAEVKGVEDARWLHAARPAGRLVVLEKRHELGRRERPAPDDERRGLEQPASVETVAVASFVAAETRSRTDDVFLDGVVEEEGPHADPWKLAVRVAGPGDADAWAYRVGARIQFGGAVRKPRRYLVLELDDGNPTLPAPSRADFISHWAVETATGRTVGLSRIHHRGTVRPLDGADVRGLADSARFRLQRSLALRIVPTRDGATFEGAWELDTLPAAADEVRFRIVFADTLPEHPRGAESRPWIERPLLPSR
jgi:alpha-beta hydrolase superfamily lysophospholipase